MNKKYYLPVITVGLAAALLNLSSCSAQNSDGKRKENKEYAMNSGNVASEKNPHPSPATETHPIVPPTGGVEGIYVASLWYKPMEDYVLTNPDVYGVFLRLHWDRMEPENGKFDWSFIDPELKRIADAGKKISIGIAAGSYSPDWIYKEGVPALDFDEFRKEGKGPAFSAKIPVPWNEKYLQAWTGFIKALADHLKSMPEVYKNITLIKISGINISTIEIRLPRQKGISNERGRGTDAPAIWRNAGYKPQLVRQAWKQILQSYNENFGDKYLSMAIIPKVGFPLIDDSGKEMGENKDYDFTKVLVDDAHEFLKDRFVVQWNAVGVKGNIPKIMDWVSGKGIKIGYQLEESDLGKPECLEKKTPCDQEMFKAVLNTAVNNNAAFVEIFVKDVKAFPQAIAYGRNKIAK
jgi:glycosyl hydrolase family 42 (putative beta-galactosidase)